MSGSPERKGEEPEAADEEVLAEGLYAVLADTAKATPPVLLTELTAVDVAVISVLIETLDEGVDVKAAQPYWEITIMASGEYLWGTPISHGVLGAILNFYKRVPSRREIAGFVAIAKRWESAAIQKMTQEEGEALLALREDASEA